MKNVDGRTWIFDGPTRLLERPESFESDFHEDDFLQRKRDGFETGIIIKNSPERKSTQLARITWSARPVCSKAQPMRRKNRKCRELLASNRPVIYDTCKITGNCCASTDRRLVVARLLVKKT